MQGNVADQRHIQIGRLGFRRRHTAGGDLFFIQAVHQQMQRGLGEIVQQGGGPLRIAGGRISRHGDKHHIIRHFAGCLRERIKRARRIQHQIIKAFLQPGQRLLQELFSHFLPDGNRRSGNHGKIGDACSHQRLLHGTVLAGQVAQVEYHFILQAQGQVQPALSQAQVTKADALPHFRQGPSQGSSQRSFAAAALSPGNHNDFSHLYLVRASARCREPPSRPPCP